MSDLKKKFLFEADSVARVDSQGNESTLLDQDSIVPGTNVAIEKQEDGKLKITADVGEGIGLSLVDGLICCETYEEEEVV